MHGSRNDPYTVIKKDSFLDRLHGKDPCLETLPQQESSMILQARATLQGPDPIRLPTGSQVHNSYEFFSVEIVMTMAAKQTGCHRTATSNLSSQERQIQRARTREGDDRCNCKCLVQLDKVCSHMTMRGFAIVSFDVSGTSLLREGSQRELFTIPSFEGLGRCL